MTTKIDEAFERWWRENESDMSSSSPRPSERAAWKASRLAALADVRAVMPTQAYGSVQRMKDGPQRMAGWNRCLSVMEERLDALGKETG